MNTDQIHFIFTKNKMLWLTGTKVLAKESGANTHTSFKNKPLPEKTLITIIEDQKIIIV